MKRQHFLIWVTLFFCPYVYGQDQTNFTQFFLNPYLLNPSYAGIDGRAALGITYRKQWATIQDGPVLGNVTFHSPVSRRVSMGLSATNDKRGLLDNTGLMLTFGYNIPLSDVSFFRFGLSGGVATNTVDLDRLQGFEDPALVNLLDNNMSVLGNTGVSFHLNTFHAGFSLPVIFEPSYISKDAFSITEIKPFQSLIFHFSNRFYFNNNHNIFEPYVVYRMNAVLPPQFEVAGILHFNHVLWAGGSFKQDFGISALGGVKLKNSLAIGASYSLKNSGVNELNSPTYEISLGILFGKNRREVPVYSFVNTEKEKKKKGTGKSASEMLAEKHRQDEIARKKQQEELARKKQQEELAKKQQEELAKKQQEELARKQQEDLAKKQQEDLAKKQQEDLAKKQQQDSQKQQAEQLAKKQQEDAAKQEQARLQQQQSEALAKQQQADALQKQQADLAQKQRDEQLKKQQEELAKKQQEEQVRKQQEETARVQREELARKEQEEAKRKLQAEQAKRDADALAAKNNQQQVARVETKPNPVIPEPDPVYSQTIRQDTIVVKHKPRFNHIDASLEILNVEITEHNDEDELERLARLKLHANDPDEHHGSDDPHPNSERHEFFKKGTHKQELDVSDYVITGVFRSESNARRFTDGLKKMGFKAKYGHLTEKAVWYVYLHQTNDINVARTERDRYRKMKIFRDAWLLTVHH